MADCVVHSGGRDAARRGALWPPANAARTSRPTGSARTRETGRPQLGSISAATVDDALQVQQQCSHAWIASHQTDVVTMNIAYVAPYQGTTLLKQRPSL